MKQRKVAQLKIVNESPYHLTAKTYQLEADERVQVQAPMVLDSATDPNADLKDPTQWTGPAISILGRDKDAPRWNGEPMVYRFERWIPDLKERKRYLDKSWKVGESAELPMYRDPKLKDLSITLSAKDLGETMLVLHVKENEVVVDRLPIVISPPHTPEEGTFVSLRAQRTFTDH